MSERVFDTQAAGRSDSDSPSSAGSAPPSTSVARHDDARRPGAESAATRGSPTKPLSRTAGATLAPNPSHLSAAPLESRSLLRVALAAFLIALWITSVALASTELATESGWWSLPELVTRVASAVATWVAIVALARRCGGRCVVIGLLAAVPLGLVAAFPENWALAGSAVVAATSHGILAMVLTRPAHGWRVLRELVVSALLGLAGALVVAGFDVELRPFRFRALVLAVVLIAALVLAWRFGHGLHSLGRRGVWLIAVGVVVLIGSVAYVQAIRTWGSPGVAESLGDFKASVADLVGAAPRPVEALVGFPALMWGVSIRHRRRQGWWMCAFGALGAAGIATALVQPETPLRDSLSASVYDVVIGAVLGIFLIAVDARVTSRRIGQVETDASHDIRPEPSRLAPLL
ncbi:MAG: hypothetical protein WKF73_11855 [Nocardioidaceae bacterium]